jgi:hypothetical protein
LFGFILSVIVVAALHDECEALLRQKKIVMKKNNKMVLHTSVASATMFFDCNEAAFRLQT